MEDKLVDRKLNFSTTTFSLACKTIDDLECIFPFIYEGQTYNNCITIHNNGIPWCPTQLDSLGNYNGYWNNCGLGCEPPQAPAAPSTNATNNSCRTTSGPDVLGRNCVFPFIYYGQMYQECIDMHNYGIPWCPTELDYDGKYIDGKWGNCSDECSSKDFDINRNSLRAFHAFR